MHALFLQNVLQQLSGPGTGNADVQRSFGPVRADGNRRTVLSGRQDLCQLRFLKSFPVIGFAGSDHGTDALLIQGNARFLGDPRHIQNIDKFLRVLLFEHIVQPPDAVTAGGEDQAVIVPSHHILQHPLGKAADVGMHAQIGLPEAGHLRLDPLRLDAHGLKNLHRRVFTNIT